MSRIVYDSNRPPARKGWDHLDRLVWWALTRRESSTFEDIADRLPEGMEGVPDRHILLALHAFARAGRAEHVAGEWRAVREAPVVGIADLQRKYNTTRKAA